MEFTLFWLDFLLRFSDIVEVFCQTRQCVSVTLVLPAPPKFQRTRVSGRSQLFARECTATERDGTCSAQADKKKRHEHMCWCVWTSWTCTQWHGAPNTQISEKRRSVGFHCWWWIVGQRTNRQFTLCSSRKSIDFGLLAHPFRKLWVHSTTNNLHALHKTLTPATRTKLEFFPVVSECASEFRQSIGIVVDWSR